jgi:hypothetical protein
VLQVEDDDDHRQTQAQNAPPRTRMTPVNT